MVAINEILLPECTGEGCDGDNDICTDSRVHYRNAENRAPVTRNHRSAPTLGRWPTRDPIGYRREINLFGFVNSSPVGMEDPEGTVAIPIPRDAPQAVTESVLAAILAAYLLYLIHEAAKLKCKPNKQRCNPCIPPAGTICVTRGDIVPPGNRHHPHPGDHAHLLRVNQSGPVKGCKCYLNPFGSASPDAARQYPGCPAEDTLGGGVI